MSSVWNSLVQLVQYGIPLLLMNLSRIVVAGADSVSSVLTKNLLNLAFRNARAYVDAILREILRCQSVILLLGVTHTATASDGYNGFYIRK